MDKEKFIKARGALGALLDKHNEIENLSPRKKSKKQPDWLRNADKTSGVATEHGGYDISNITDTPQLLTLPSEICTPWFFADRDEREMGDITDLANSIKEAGQLEPVLCRPYTGSQQEFKFEVVFGNRRLRATQFLKINILALVRQLSDQDAALMQKEENDQRKNISDFSRAFNYKKLIDKKIFASETDLATHLRIPKQTLNNIFSFTRIPQEVLTNLKDPFSLSQQMALKIASLSKDNNHKQKLVMLAPEIGTKKISSPAKLIAYIQKSDKENKTAAGTTNNITYICNQKDVKVFTLRKDANGNDVVVINKSPFTKQARKDLLEIIEKYVEENC